MKWLFLLLFTQLFTQAAFAGTFEEQLGPESMQLSHVQTDEDKKQIGLFSAMYDLARKMQSSKESIPKVLHLIWLGPQALPAESIATVAHWIDLHPGWKVKFWSDMERPLPDPRMELHLLQDFPLNDLKNLYYQCDNFGERSLLLRYAILLQEGGVCFEHDTLCLQSLEALRAQYDFFCGMEGLAPTILSSSVNPSPHLIGAAAAHPILRSAKIWLKKEWEKFDRDYPGSDPMSIYNRVQRRAFRALGVGVKQEHNRNGRRDIVFPPCFFSLKDPLQAKYVAHLHQGTWYHKRSEAEIKVQKLLENAVSSTQRSFLLVLVLTALNLVTALFIFNREMRRRKLG